MVAERDTLASCHAAGAPPPRVGLIGQSECVIRGGYLRRPIVLQGCATVADRQFTYLWKTSPDVHAMFAPASSCMRGLSKVTIFNDMKISRNKACKDELVKLVSEQASTSFAHHENTEDPTMALGLDAIETAVAFEDMTTQQVRNCRRMKNRCRAAWAQMPKTIQIDVNLRNGKTWSPHVWVTSDSSQAVGMECTTENFCHLWHLIAAQQSQIEQKPAIMKVLDKCREEKKSSAKYLRVEGICVS